MPTADEILGPEPQGKPTADDLLGPEPKPDFSSSSGYAWLTGAPADAYMSQGPVSRFLDAFGQGVKDNWGAGGPELAPETEKFLKGADFDKNGDARVMKTFNETVFRPLASAFEVGMRAASAGFSGLQAGTAAVLPRDIAALPEAFFGGAEFGMPPHPMAYLAPQIAKARSLGVIGEGEGAYMGTAERKPIDPEVQAQAVKEQIEAAPEQPETPPATPAPTPEPAPAPDIHAVARQIAPDTFSGPNGYDALVQRQDTFRRWIDELSQTREQEARANAPHAEEIASLQAKLEDATPRMAKKYQASIDELTPAHDAYIDEQLSKDTPDMQRIRAELQKTDYAMRDLAPEVSAAYRQAQEQMPQAEAPAEVLAETQPEAAQPAQAAEAPQVAETPQAPQAAPAAAPETAPEQQPEIAPASIASDVSQKLAAAGRPQEEADAAAALVQAHYEARAARFGHDETAEDMYARDGANIEGATKGRKGEQGRTVLKDGQATIRLMKNADASTFIHETGHHWLDEMMRDAEDERAPDDLKADAKTVRDWLGQSEGDIPTKAHEKFARGFERYLMEGRAPSQGLASVFAKFKDWLTQIYQTVAKLRSPISDDIRDVFDRLLSANPQPTVIAPDRQLGLEFADIHEADAEHTPPEQAEAARDRIRTESDAVAQQHAPEVHDELTGRPGGQNSGQQTPGGEADRNGDAGQPLPGEAGAGPEPGAVGAGGGQAGPEGAGARTAEKPKPVTPEVYKTVPKEPLRLLDFLRREGGVRDLGGDIAQIMGGPGGKRGLRNLINNKTGKPVLEAIERAWEAGYFPGVLDPKQITESEFFDAIERDAKQQPVYSEHDDALVNRYRDAMDHNAEVDRLSDRLGIDPAGKSKAEFWDAVTEKLSTDKAATEAESLAAAHEAALAEAEKRAKEWVESRGEAWEPDQFYDMGEPRSLEELEREHQQEDAARRGGQVQGGTEQPGASAGNQGSVQEGGGQGVSGAGADGRDLTPGEGSRNTAGKPRTEQPAGPNERFAEPAESALVDKAGNIRLDNLGTPEDVNAAIRQAADENEGFITARRGVISDAQVLDLADALGMDAAELNTRKLGQAFNAEQIVAARKLLIQSATTVRDAMIKAADGSDADLMAYAEAKTRHRMIQEQVSGITAEAGRALRAFRQLEGAEEAQMVGDFLQQATGQTLFQLRREAELGKSLDTPQKVSKFVNDSVKPSFGDMVLEYWINGLISGPATHTTYSVGNTLLALWKAVPETAISAAIGALHGGEKVYAGEVGANLYGMVRGAREGVLAAWEAAKTGVTTALPGEDAAKMAMQSKAIPGVVGEVVRVPSRVIAMIHSFFRAVNYSMAKDGLAYRTAASEGLTGTDFARRVGEVSTNPSEEIMAQARGVATDLTLMGQGGAFTQALSRLTNISVNLPLVGQTKLLKFVDPFVHISSNVIEQSLLQRTPLGVFSSEIRNDLMGKNGAIARDQAAARMIAGTALGVTMGGLAAEGLVSGSGPSDPKEAAMWRLAGNQAHSIKIGDVWYDAHRLGPLGMLVGVSGDLYEVAHALSTEDSLKVAGMLSHAFTQNILDESFMRGPADLIRALSDQDRYGAAYVRNMAASFVPYSVGMSQIARAVDPDTRQARTLMDAVKAKVPFLSETLLPRRDIWGEPVPNKDVLGVAGLSAIYEQKVSNDPVNQAMLRLGIYPAQPSRKIRNVELTDRQYDDYSRIAGRLAKMRLNQTVAQPGFTSLPPAAQQDIITGIIKGSRESAASLVMMQNPGIIQAAMDAKTAPLRDNTVKQRGTIRQAAQ